MFYCFFQVMVYGETIIFGDVQSNGQGQFRLEVIVIVFCVLVVGFFYWGIFGIIFSLIGGYKRDRFEEFWFKGKSLIEIWGN